MLGYCNDCKENSVKVKVYTSAVIGTKRRLSFCLNKSCGFQQDMPFPEETKGFCTDTYKTGVHNKGERDE